MEFNVRAVNGKLALLDEILECDMTSQEYLNNEIVLKGITTLIDELDGVTTGHALVSMENGNKTTILLIVIEKKDVFKLYTWIRNEVIERPLSFTIHSKNYTENIDNLIEEAYKNTPLSKDEVVSVMLNQSLTGFSINRNKVREYIDFNNSGKSEYSIKKEDDDEFSARIKSLSKYLKKTNKEAKEKIIDQVSSFTNKLNCDALKINLSIGGLNTDQLVIGQIVDVRLVGDGKRHYKIDYINIISNSDIKRGQIVNYSTPNKYGVSVVNKLGEIYVSDSKRTYYNENGFNTDTFNRIPYNYIDVGRYLVGVNRKYNDFKLIMGADPRLDKNHEETLKNVFKRFAEHCVLKDISLTGTEIVTEKNKYYYDAYESRIKSNITSSEAKEKGLRLKFQALQKMVNEYKYLDKKQMSIGKDVLITDKVKYNHTEGKISYNDFSIAVDDEIMKEALYTSFERYLLEFYRGTLTEEAILNGLLSKFFEELKGRMSVIAGTGFETTIKINDVTNIKLIVKKTKSNSNLIYLNDIRFNKNEVITVLREMTCYRDPAESARFIKNIGKLGLSVYIAITTGYEVNSNRIYKFKKEKGRSAYKLILDDIEIPITGKRLISLLYSNFIGDFISGFNTKIQKTIYDGVGSSLDYLKYKFLINSCYESFKQKSKEFLEKKVSDVEGTFCRYKPDNKKKDLDAIKLTGMSGNEYIIAYDTKDSFVFMNPKIQDSQKNLFGKGKYICMIDQSNIKSNIGYDTVISKLMALKNDSIIAGTIYNLEEELV